MATLVTARETGKEIRAEAEEERADRESVTRFRIQETTDQAEQAAEIDRKAGP